METKAHTPTSPRALTTPPQKSPKITDSDEPEKLLKERQVLAEQFRLVADDHGAVTKLAEDTHKATTDPNIQYLCQRFRTAKNPYVVRALADQVKAGLDCCDMTLEEQKALAEKFRAVADDRVAVAKLADDTCTCRLVADPECVELCGRFQAAPSGDVVRAIADEVKAKRLPEKPAKKTEV